MQVLFFLYYFLTFAVHKKRDIRMLTIYISNICSSPKVFLWGSEYPFNQII